MARIGMEHFVKLAFSLDRLKKNVEEAKTRGVETVTVKMKDLDQIVTTLGNFDVQILNKRETTP
jgi:hypothetical protein